MADEAHRVSVVIDRVRFPKLAAFVEWGVDMQLADVRDLLRLPLPDADLHAGQNFAAAAALVNFIAGASVWFYDASEDGLSNRGDRTRRYRETLERYWPWDNGEDVPAAEGVQVLYDYTRNPLAHSFGPPDPADGTLISIAKRPLSEAEIVELDTAEPGHIGSGLRSNRPLPRLLGAPTTCPCQRCIGAFDGYSAHCSPTRHRRSAPRTWPRRSLAS